MQYQSYFKYFSDSFSIRALVGYNGGVPSLPFETAQASLRPLAYLFCDVSQQVNEQFNRNPLDSMFVFVSISVPNECCGLAAMGWPEST